MKQLTKAQQDIINEMARMARANQLALDLDTPMIIFLRNPITNYGWEEINRYNLKYDNPTYVKGYTKAAEGLRQRGLIMRDSHDRRYWFTTFGIQFVHSEPLEIRTNVSYVV